MAMHVLDSGAAWNRFCAFIIAQGGDKAVLEEPERLALSKYQEKVVAGTKGFVQTIDAEKIGMASQHAGAGREKVEDAIDPGAGVLLHKKVGHKVLQGDVLATVYSGSRKKAAAAAKEVLQAFAIGEKRLEVPPLVKEIVQ